MYEGTPLYFPVSIYSWGTVNHTYAPMRSDPPSTPELLQAYVLTERTGSMPEGLYVLEDTGWWRHALGQPYLSDVVFSGDRLNVYLNPTDPVAVPAGSSVYRNSVRIQTQIIQGRAVFCVVVPKSTPSPVQEKLVLIAGRNISGHRVIKAADGKADYASSTVFDDANKVLGISAGAALAGSEATIKTSGVMTETSWNWNVNLPVFNGVDGLLTQSSPSVGYSLVVGIPISPTTILVSVKQPIVTS